MLHCQHIKVRVRAIRGFLKPLVFLALLGMPLVAGAAPPRGHRGAAAAQHPRSSSQTPVPPAPVLGESRSLQAQLADLQEQKSAAEKRAEILGTDLRRLQAELSAIRQASANTLQIQAERDDLQEQLIRLKRELETTRRAKQGLEEDDRQTWFLTGAGVLLAGIAGGVIIPRLSWRRRSGWDTY